MESGKRQTEWCSPVLPLGHANVRSLWGFPPRNMVGKRV